MKEYRVQNDKVRIVMLLLSAIPIVSTISDSSRVIALRAGVTGPANLRLVVAQHLEPCHYKTTMAMYLPSLHNLRARQGSSSASALRLSGVDNQRWTSSCPSTTTNGVFDIRDIVASVAIKYRKLSRISICLSMIPFSTYSLGDSFTRDKVRLWHRSHDMPLLSRVHLCPYLLHGLYLLKDFLPPRFQLNSGYCTLH